VHQGRVDRPLDRFFPGRVPCTLQPKMDHVLSICPRSCRCWPRPGLFSQEEATLLARLTRWGERSEGPRACDAIDMVTELGTRVGADRMGYVLSTPLALYGSLRWTGSVLDRALDLYRDTPHGTLALVLLLVFTYGVCTETGKEGSEEYRPWRADCAFRLHPGRMETAPARKPLRFASWLAWETIGHWNGSSPVVETALLRAGARPWGKHDQDRMNAWHRWHGFRTGARRRWLATLAPACPAQHPSLPSQ
jgi:hypothetical protein